MELFKGFLADEKIYIKATDYWDDLCIEIFKKNGQSEEWSQWFSLKYADGTPMMDGNPISTWINKKRKKGIRIIQVEKSILTITAYMNIFDSDVEAVPEIVIHCYLTTETAKKASFLIDNWLSGKFEFNQMEKEISKALGR